MIKRHHIANFDEKSFWKHTYAISNECGLICIAYGNSMEDALDAAVDSDKMDCQKMSDEDYAEYDAKGWEDSFICAGNAGEPFWSDYLHIALIR